MEPTAQLVQLALQAQSLDGQISALVSQVENADVALKRAQDLLKSGFTTRAAFDQAKTNADVPDDISGKPGATLVTGQQAPAVETGAAPAPKVEATSAEAVAVPAKASINWAQILGVVLQAGEALAVDIPEIILGQAVQAPVIYVYLGAHRYAIAVTATPAPLA